jgi:hypothetical protein
MADRPWWMEYADLVAKFTVPLAVVAATAIIGYCSSQRQARADIQKVRDTRLQACIDKQFLLANFGCKDAACATLTKDQGYKLANLTKAVSALCEGTGFGITAGVQAQVKSSVASTNSAVLTADVSNTLGSRPQTTVATSANSTTVPPALRPPPAAAGTGSASPALFVQISDESQRAPAAQLIDRLRKVTFRGELLRVYGSELKPIGKTQLRCVTRIDCASAPELASFISSVMQVNVPVTDLSRIYDARLNGRSSNYELWIAPGPVRVADPGTAAAKETLNAGAEPP